eukprot:jgi/Tetstr1/427401/TSEL_017565.t1
MDSAPSAPPAPSDWFDASSNGSGRGSFSARQGAAAREEPTASGSGRSAVPWTFPGALGGALLGTTMGGPAVGLLGGLTGCAAGLFRDLTGQSVVGSWLSRPEAEKRQFLYSAGFMLSSLSGGGGGSGSGSRVEVEGEGTPLQGGLSTEELDALATEPAARGDPQCVLCYSNKVNVVFQPCGHAQVCSKCAAQVLRLSPSCACPLCQTRIGAVSRVYIAGGA